MKKQLIWLNALLFLLIGGVLYAQTTVSIEEAIKTGAQEIETRLAAGSKVVVLNFSSPSQRFSNYALDEMMTVLVRSGKLTVVDRANLELIQKEMDFQMSGEVNDSSAQSIGQILGAQSIVSGSIEDMGVFYRLRFRTISVETAAIQVLTSLNVRKDAQIVTLLSNTGGSPASSSPVTTKTPSTSRTPTNTVQMQASPTEYPHGLNYSNGRKVGAGFLNMLVGLGSFTMGDWAGGLIVGGVEAAGIAMMISGNAIDYKSTDPEDGTGIAVSFIGFAAYGVAAVIGFVRPFSYDKALAKKRGTYIAFDASANPMQYITLAPIPTKTGMDMGLMFNVSF